MAHITSYSIQASYAESKKILGEFGPKAKKQFQQLAGRYHLEIEEVQQFAVVAYLEAQRKFDRNRGEFIQFIWWLLREALRRNARASLRFAFSIDQVKIDDNFLFQEIESVMADEADEFAHERNSTIASDKQMKPYLEMLDDISGKSSLQLARQWGITKRAANYRVAKSCARATAIRARLYSSARLETVD